MILVDLGQQLRQRAGLLGRRSSQHDEQDGLHLRLRRGSGEASRWAMGIDELENLVRCEEMGLLNNTIIYYHDIS